MICFQFWAYSPFRLLGLSISATYTIILPRIILHAYNASMLFFQENSLECGTVDMKLKACS